MIFVTGANGHLGRHVIQGLLQANVPSNEIVGLVRSAAKAGDLAALGIQLREADYSRPETLNGVFEAGSRILLISSNQLGERFTQHKAVIDAAAAAGAGLVAYTSILRADTSKLILAQEHLRTEEYLRRSNVPFVMLRNGWYFENQTEYLAAALQHGAIIGASGEGRYSSASRADFAAAAVTVLTQHDHANQVYELNGDTSHTAAELAAELSRQSGKQIPYVNMSKQQYAGALAGFGLPGPLAEAIADAEAGAAARELYGESVDLRTLAGRPTTTLAEAVRSALMLN